jgi:hypothetical protein
MQTEKNLEQIAALQAQNEELERKYQEQIKTYKNQISSKEFKFSE